MVMYQTTVTSGGLHIEGSTGGGSGRNAPSIFAGTPLPTVSPPAGALVGDLYLQHATTPTTQLIAMWELSGSGWTQLGAYADQAEVTAIANEYLVSVSTSAGTITITDQGGGITTYTSPFTSAEMTKLSGIETGATADQSAAEIKNALETLTGTNRLDASAVKNIATQSIGYASTTDAGVIRIATTLDASSLSNNTEAITPATLNARLTSNAFRNSLNMGLPLASTTTVGIVRLAASNTESTSGASNALAMTPEGTRLFGDNRYILSGTGIGLNDLTASLQSEINSALDQFGANLLYRRLDHDIDVNDLGDATITTPTEGQVLTYDLLNAHWENRSPTVGALTDVTIDTPTLADRQILRYNDTHHDWRNVALIESLEDLTDTTIDSATLANNQVLAYDGVHLDWRNITIPSAVTNLGGLSNVTLTNPADGQVLTYAAGDWVNQALPTPTTTLAALTDVTVSGPMTGQALIYGATGWLNQALPSAPVSIDDLDDVHTSTPVTGHILMYDTVDSRWENVAATLDVLTNTNISSPSDEQVLSYDIGTSRWINRTLPTSVVPALSDLTDTTITSAADGQFLGYNGTHWVNSALPAADETTVGVSRFATEPETRGGTFDDGPITPAKLLDVLTHTTGNHVRTTFLTDLDSRYRAAGAIAFGDLDSGLQGSINSILTQGTADGRYRLQTDSIALTDLTQTLQDEINSHLDQGEADLLYAPIGAPLTALSLTLPAPYGNLRITGTKQGGTTITGSVDLGSHYRLNTVQLVGTDYGAGTISEPKLDTAVRTKIDRGDQAANHATTSSYGITRLATENQSQDDTNAEDVITPHTMLYAGDRRFGPIGQDIVRQNTAILVNKHLTIPLVRQDGSTFDLTADLSAIAAPTGGTSGQLDVYYGSSERVIGSFNAATILELTHQQDTQTAARYSVTISAPPTLPADQSWVMYIVLPEDEALDYVHLGPFDILPLFSEADVTVGSDTYQVYHIDFLDAASTYDLQFEIAHFSGGVLNRNRIAHGAIGPDQLADMAVTQSKYATNSIPAGALQDNSVIRSNIAQSTIYNEHMTDSSIGSSELSPGSVQATHLSSIKRPFIEVLLRNSPAPTQWYEIENVTGEPGGMYTRSSTMVGSMVDLTRNAVLLGFNETYMNSYEPSQVLESQETPTAVNYTNGYSGTGGWDLIAVTGTAGAELNLHAGLYEISWMMGFGLPNSGIVILNMAELRNNSAISPLFMTRGPVSPNTNDYRGEMVGSVVLQLSSATRSIGVAQLGWRQNNLDNEAQEWSTSRNRRYGGYLRIERIE